MSESILVVEDTDSLREVLESVLSAEGFHVTSSRSAEEALEQLHEREFDLVLSDLRLPNQSGMDVVQAARKCIPSPPVVVMTAYGSIDIAVEAMKLGAADFIVKPFDPTLLHHTLRRIFDQKSELHQDVGAEREERIFLTQNPACEELLCHARKVAPLSSPVIITGESGTGKELLARYLHRQSPRANKPFVAVNCASMPPELLESEFFGHEAGAFTGATEKRIGLFEAASGGTIFLDEIGNMPAKLQVKLLRVLQESEIRRIGSTKTLNVNTRVICATNNDLEQQMKDGEFREDLYYRLSVVVLEISPLRKRPEDIELLSLFYLKKFAQRFHKPEPTLSEDALKWLRQYRWPGNVRELANTMERAVLFSKKKIDREAFEESLGEAEATEPQSVRALPEITSEAARNAEITAIRTVLVETKGNKLRAAKLLGVSYKTLLNKVKEYGLN